MFRRFNKHCYAYLSPAYVVVCFPYTLFSQQKGGGTITGKLIDSLSGKPMPLATVAVFSAKDTVLLTYRMSNPDGEFKVPGLPLNTALRLLISYSGYAVYRIELVLTEEHPQGSPGTIRMVPDNRSLEEVLVYAERPLLSLKRHHRIQCFLIQDPANSPGRRPAKETTRRSTGWRGEYNGEWEKGKQDSR
ncbi:carboxypeptidase regulatory-like domain-containing protein [Paraflavitalea speifideaquila]|uniref:carboxypeptidase regulatory-like domain-containing protein n=1 Tax=Paraflavitalea speifideaquila TaxID=3076558 RepID=UPI0028EC2215|nr:carboxypeptidase regulatory-like domain-containing protein [Paraflavitalea speifideiaquila]